MIILFSRHEAGSGVGFPLFFIMVHCSGGIDTFFCSTHETAENVFWQWPNLGHDKNFEEVLLELKSAEKTDPSGNNGLVDKPKQICSVNSDLH